MDIREKLVELLDEAYRNAEETCRKTDCENCCVSSKPVNSCVMTLIADNLITNGVQVQEWISVDERLPEKSGEYLTYCGDYDGVCVLYYEVLKTKGKWRTRWKEVTHWMPLPSAPKGE